LIFCPDFCGSIPDISELSILLVLRGAIPGIHGRELLRRESRLSKSRPVVIASQRVRAKRGTMTGSAKQSRAPTRKQSGLLRRSAPRNDEKN
jgi:hypothetical protein